MTATALASRIPRNDGTIVLEPGIYTSISTDLVAEWARVH